MCQECGYHIWYHVIIWWVNYMDLKWQNENYRLRSSGNSIGSVLYLQNRASNFIRFNGFYFSVNMILSCQHLLILSYCACCFDWIESFCCIIVGFDHYIACVDRLVEIIVNISSPNQWKNSLNKCCWTWIRVFRNMNITLNRSIKWIAPTNTNLKKLVGTADFRASINDNYKNR